MVDDKLTPAPMVKHRPKEFHLPADPREATALALAVIRGDNSVYAASTIEGLSARITKLVDADSTDALEELAAHLPILETLFIRFSTDAMNVNYSPSQKAILIRMALASQTNFSRTMALIAGLNLQRQGKAQVIIDDYGRGDL